MSDLLRAVLSWAIWLYAAYFVIFLSLLVPIMVLYMVTPAGTKFSRSLWFFMIPFTIAGVSGAMIPFFLLRPKHYQNMLVINWLLRKLSYIVGTTWEIRGANIASEERGAVICCNHQSSIDIFGN